MFSQPPYFNGVKLAMNPGLVTIPTPPIPQDDFLYMDGDQVRFMDGPQFDFMEE